MSRMLARLLILPIMTGLSLSQNDDPYRRIFDEALDAARQADKPLVVDVSMSKNCGACARLREGLQTHVAAPVLSTIHLIETDIEKENGAYFRVRFDTTRTPTLLAFDHTGREIGRQAGFQSLRRTLSWLVQLRARMDSLDRTAQKASVLRDDLGFQLGLAQRLRELGHPAESRTYFLRAARSTDPIVAIPALLSIGEIDHPISRGRSRLRAAELIAERFPSSEDAESALHLLAKSNSSARRTAKALDSALAVEGLGMEKLDQLLWLAFRARLLERAALILDRLEPHLNGQGYVRRLYHAEWAHISGNLPRALELIAEMRELAPNAVASAFLDTLEARYKRGRREPSESPLLDLFRRS